MEDDILIDNYLKGLLSKDEKESFLERLMSDVDFKENFELEEQLFHALNDRNWSFSKNQNVEVEGYVNLLEENDLQDLKKTLAVTNSKFNANKSKPTKRLFYYLAAASLIFLLGFQFFFNKTVSNQDLYNDYLALNDLPSFVSRSDTSSELTTAQRLFENKNYEEALSIFSSIKEQQEYKATLIVYKGISEIELEKYKAAENTFNSLIESDLLDAEKGYWYKALAFLKADRVVEAEKVLSVIVSKSLYKNSEAKALLEKIKR